MRWFLLIFCGWLVSTAALANYVLTPKEIAENTYLLEGSTDNFSKDNGGNIVNVAFIVTDAGVVVIDRNEQFIANCQQALQAWITE